MSVGKLLQNYKEILTSDIIMGHPQDQGEFILDTDACDYGLGCVHSQKQSGQEKVIAYARRTLSKAEKNF